MKTGMEDIWLLYLFFTAYLHFCESMVEYTRIFM